MASVTRLFSVSVQSVLAKLALVLLCLFAASCSRNIHEAQGYVEGRYTYISSPVAGYLRELFVVRGTRVASGQPLLHLDVQPESDAQKAAAENLRQSLSSRDSIVANLDYATKTVKRYQALVEKRVLDQASLDNARAGMESTQAQLFAADATISSLRALLSSASWKVSQKTLSAPLAAEVFDTYYRIGEYVAENQPVLSLLAPENVRAIFYISEKEEGAIHLEDRVMVACDGCKKNLAGRVSFISPSAEYTPPVIYSRDTSEKLVFRIEADFPAETAVLLHPGQPVTVRWLPHEQ